jgi:Zn-dependent protease
MHSWRNFVSKVKKYWPLESFEKRGLLITIVVLAFIFSFRQWGIEKFDVALGIQNLLLSLVIVVLAFVVHEVAHRTIAVWMGYRSQYRGWILGLVIGLVVAFVSNGHLLFLAPGSLVITHFAHHRLGWKYHELNIKHLGWIAMSGPIALMIFAVILKALATATGYQVFHKAMIVFIWIALFDMVPIPPFNGCRTFFGSRYVYVFVLGSLIGIAAMLVYLSGIVPLIGGVVLGALILLIFFVMIDKRWIT